MAKRYVFLSHIWMLFVFTLAIDTILTVLGYTEPSVAIISAASLLLFCVAASVLSYLNRRNTGGKCQEN